jgi:proteasome lid subunit RPN8/RPN11
MEIDARSAYPAECCGLLSGTNGLITGHHSLRNTSGQPQISYFAAPEDLFSAMKQIRDDGRALIGIYHSHPRTPAYPSNSDVEMAFYPEAIYFILSVEPRLDLRAFRIIDSRVEDVTVDVVDAKAEI